MSLSKTAIISFFVAGAFVAACSGPSSDEPKKISAKDAYIAAKALSDEGRKNDKFTYANYDKVRVTHIDLNLDVNFDEKVLEGVATLDIERIYGGENMLALDTKDLTIKSIDLLIDGKVERRVSYALRQPDAVLGQGLSFPISPFTEQVKIAYRTSPKAEGLQWLSPEQTAGTAARHPRCAHDL